MWKYSIKYVGLLQ